MTRLLSDLVQRMRSRARHSTPRPPSSWWLADRRGAQEPHPKAAQRGPSHALARNTPLSPMGGDNTQFIADDKLSRLQTAIKEEEASIQAKVKVVLKAGMPRARVS